MIELNNHDEENVEWKRNLAFVQAVLIAIFMQENKPADVEKYNHLLAKTLGEIPRFKKYDSETFVADRVSSIGGKL